MRSTAHARFDSSALQKLTCSKNLFRDSDYRSQASKQGYPCSHKRKRRDGARQTKALFKMDGVDDIKTKNNADNKNNMVRVERLGVAALGSWLGTLSRREA